MDRKRKAFGLTANFESTTWATKLAIGAAVLWVVGYIFAILLVPSMPVGDPLGGYTQIPRLELWLLYVASFGSIWEQWTAGYPATVIDRVGIGLGAGVWLVIAFVLGRPVVRQDALRRIHSPWVTSMLAIACGSAIAAVCVACNGISFGTQSRWGMAVWFSGAWFAVSFGLPRLSNRLGSSSEIAEPPPSPTAALQPPDDATPDDATLDYSWSRRLLGLTAIGCFWVAILLVAGACLPSYDVDVREHRMMAAKEYFLSGAIHSIPRNSETDAPQASMMPALFWMNILSGPPSQPLESRDLRKLMDAVLIGQVAQAAQWLVGLVMLCGLLAKRYGKLAATLVTFAVVAHPGMFELVRLGGGAGGAGLWIVSAVALLLCYTPTPFPKWSALCIASGAMGTSSILTLMVAAPLSIAILRDGAAGPTSGSTPSIKSRALRCTWLLFFLVVIGGGWWGRSALAVQSFSDGWGRAGGLSEAWLAHRFPLWGMPWIDQVATGVNALGRVLFDSTAHGLILIPLSLVGWIVARDRIARDTGLWWAVWLIVWWLLTPQMDRDWVLAIPLLAWPAAHGVAWLQRHSQRTALLVIGGVSLTWSVVMLAAWPTSDNRILAPMHALLEAPSRSDGSEQGRGAATVPVYVDWLNTFWKTKLTSDERPGNLLVVGSADAFRLQMPTLVNGLFDLGLWDGLESGLTNGNLTDTTIQEWLSQNRVHQIVFDWRSLRTRDAILGLQREARYREILQRLLGSGILRAIPWDFLSSEAELFEVVTTDRARQPP